MKSRVLAPACLAALLSLTGCSGKASHASYRVTGVAGSDVPLAGVPVTATDRAGKHTLSSVTDAHGRFTIVLNGLC